MVHIWLAGVRSVGDDGSDRLMYSQSPVAFMRLRFHLKMSPQRGLLAYTMEVNNTLCSRQLL